VIKGHHKPVLGPGPRSPKWGRLRQLQRRQGAWHASVLAPMVSGSGACSNKPPLHAEFPVMASNRAIGHSRGTVRAINGAPFYTGSCKRSQSDCDRGPSAAWPARREKPTSLDQIGALEVLLAGFV